MKIKDLFYIYQGNGFELINMSILKSSNINFVSRTSENNGVVATVEEIKNRKPFKAGLITVALGGSVLSSFVQLKDFYTSFHIMVLEPKLNLSLEQKLYYCMVIENNKYRYSYGRQANRTLADLDIPSIEECNKTVKNFRVKRIKTSNNLKKIIDLDLDNWKEFKLSDFFEIIAGKYHFPDEYENGTTPYVSASNLNNGIAQRINLVPDFKGNCIVTGKVGCTAFYQSEDFCATSDVNVLKPKQFVLNKYIGLFIVSIINHSENCKWNYGRQCRVGDTKEIFIKLPTQNNKPNWQFMEDYIKSLPYADKI